MRIIIGYCSEGSFIGFISFWEFKDYLYIEHFAINNEIRGKGYGSTILNKFIKSTPKTILLEIDPIIDDISNARCAADPRPAAVPVFLSCVSLPPFESLI